MTKRLRIGKWSLRLSIHRKRPVPLRQCMLMECSRPAEPQEGPFCPHHSWADFTFRPRG